MAVKLVKEIVNQDADIFVNIVCALYFSFRSNPNFKTMKLISKLLFLALILVGFTQCKKDDNGDGDGKVGDANPGQVVFKLGDDTFTMTDAAAVILDFSLFGTPGQSLTITGSYGKKSAQGENALVISVYDANDLQEKEYQFTVDEEGTSWASISMADYRNDQYTSYVGVTGEGSIDIVKISSNSISGTFSGTFYVSSTDPDLPETISVTGGAFNSIPLSGWGK